MQEFNYSDENIIETINKNYFQRIKLLKRIIKKISEDTNDIKSICINAPWGTGKTVFVHELKYLINNSQDLSKLNNNLDLSEIKSDEHIGCFYFNSWENDSINLPTLSLLYNILKDETWVPIDIKEQYNELVSKTGDLLIKIISRGSLSLNYFKDKNPSIFDEIFSSNKIKEEFNNTIDKYLEINSFKKLVIILDELDRCRPDYAVNMLESIKHFFNNEKLIFIISTDLIQLNHTIKKFYGDQYNSDLYLQRFFDRIITLDTPNMNDYIYYELGVNLDDHQLKNSIIKFCIEKLDMSTREINTFIATFNRIQNALSSSFPNNHITISYNLFLIFATALKIKNISEYSKCINGKFTKQDFENYFLNSSILDILAQYAMKQNSNVIEYLYDLYSEIFVLNKLNYLNLNCANRIKSLIKYEI